MKVDVLGVKIDDVNMEEAIETVEGWLSKPGPASPAKRGEKHYIVTPNPEFLVTAQKDTEFRKTLNSADLSIPDGVGLKLAGVKNNVPGVDLMLKLVKVASEKGYTVSFLGGRARVAEKTAERLVGKYPNLQVVFVSEEWSEDGFVNEGKRFAKSMDLLFVAFGAPKQEKWIAANLGKLPVKVAMGVGGAFDYLSGQVPRAPKWIHSLGLEWLFRLVTQPWRWRRQLALIKYIFLLKLKDKSW